MKKAKRKPKPEARRQAAQERIEREVWYFLRTGLGELDVIHRQGKMLS